MKLIFNGILKISEIFPNENNPRFIKDAAFKNLCDSIREDPEYFKSRPVVCSNRTGENVIMGGNMRYRASRHLNMSEIPVAIYEMTEDEEKRITIKDNSDRFGEWDIDMITSLGFDDILKPSWGVGIGFGKGNSLVNNNDDENKKNNNFKKISIKFPMDCWDISELEIMEKISNICSEYGAEFK